MNTYELQHRFNLEMEKHGVIDPVMSTIVEDYINYAYQNYVTEKFDSLINNIEKFEVTERISRILAPLMVDFTSAAFTSITTNSPYGYYVALPADLQYIVTENLTISYTDCNGDISSKVCKIIPVKHNMITSNADNPFLKPDDDEVWRINIYSNRIELILYNGVTPTSYKCRYIRKLIDVSFTTDTTIGIDDSVHEEIVVRAAYMYLGDLRSNTKKEEGNV